MTEQTEVLRYIEGPVCTNCYLLVNHKTGELLVVDPGDQAQLIEKQIEKNATNSVKLKELFEEQEKIQTQLDEKTERWFYLNELAEKIGCV